MSRIDKFEEEGRCVLYTGNKPDFSEQQFEIIGSGEDAFSYARANGMLEGSYHWDGFDDDSGSFVGGQVGFLKTEQELSEQKLKELKKLAD
jgi:hypothetical protein